MGGERITVKFIGLPPLFAGTGDDRPNLPIAKVKRVTLGGKQVLLAVGHGMDAKPFVGQKTVKTTVFVFRSDDEGRSFRYLSRVPCSASMEFCACPCLSNGRCLPTTNCTTTDAIGGPAEPTIEQLPGGELMLLFRVTGRPCMASYSKDGSTWTTPTETPIWSVWPDLAWLPNGVLVATSGRPSLGLWWTSDPTGHAGWQFVNLAAVHNRLLPRNTSVHFNGRDASCGSIFCSSCWNPAENCTVETTSYTGLHVLDHHVDAAGTSSTASVLISYDRLANAWHGPPGANGKADQVFVLRVAFAFASDSSEIPGAGDDAAVAPPPVNPAAPAGFQRFLGTASRPLLGSDSTTVAAATQQPPLVSLAPAPPQLVSLRIAADGQAFSVYVRGEQWLQGAPVRVFVLGAWHSSADGSLVLINATNTSGFTNSDSIGAFALHSFSWLAGSVPVDTSIRVYQHHPALLFSITFPAGATGTSHNTSMLSTEFPAIVAKAAKLPSLGSLCWSTAFCNSLTQGYGAPTGGKDHESATVLYNEFNSTSMVVSPASGFMTVQHTQTKAGAWAYGVGSEVDQLPKGHSYQTILVAADGGITAALDTWGALMQTKYSTTKIYDRSVSTLGYSTDRGSYYYFFARPPPRRGPDSVGFPERKVLELAQYYREQGVPIGYYQLDAFWYQCDGWNACIQNFEPRPNYFPSGLGKLSASTGVPFSLYSNYFCPANNYSGFEFTSADGTSAGHAGYFAQVVPWQSRDFYKQLISQGKGQSMVSFELDYETTTWHAFSSFRNNVTYAADWLDGMGAALDDARIPVQWCMSTPRFILQSLLYPAVTNARASVDFAQDGGGNLYRFGYSAPFISAVGLRPSKDGFWTRGPTQPPDDWYTPAQTDKHPNPTIHAIVATLSMGPVAIQDRVNYTDTALIKRSCMSNGTLLQPSRALSTSDSAFALSSRHKQGTGQSAHEGHIWRTMSQVWSVANVSNGWHFVLGFNLGSQYVVSASDLAPPPATNVYGGQLTGWTMATDYTRQTFAYRAFSWPRCANNTDVGAHTPCAKHWNGAAPNGPVLGIGQNHNSSNKNGTMQWELVTLAPIFSNGMAILGELDKWASVSPNRFLQIKIARTDTTLTIAGAVGEAIAITVLVPSNNVAATRAVVVLIVMPSQGVATVSINVSGEFSMVERSPPLKSDDTVRVGLRPHINRVSRELCRQAVTCPHHAGVQNDKSVHTSTTCRGGQPSSLKTDDLQVAQSNDNETVFVHVIVHTHDDTGWDHTINGYFTGAVRNILSNATRQLVDDPDRRFIYVEIAFFQLWWREQSSSTKMQVRELVRTGQLEFINAGWTMSDEGTVHFSDDVDQMTLGQAPCPRPALSPRPLCPRHPLTPPSLPPQAPVAPGHLRRRDRANRWVAYRPVRPHLHAGGSLRENGL